MPSQTILDRYTWRETLKLIQPIKYETWRKDDQYRTFLLRQVILQALCNKTDCLYGLSKTHVIRETGTKAMLIKKFNPCAALILIRTKFCIKAFR